MVLLLEADGSFITNEEYARMLYQNPRGISCAKCHGEKGEGKVLSTYVDHGKSHSIQAPPIYNLSMERFKKALSRKGRLMPQYFLTEWEMAHLYYYLLTQNPDYNKNKTKGKKHDS
ncbi:MAG: cytochrome c [Sulfurospirillum sp.]|nr:MAG: cytochrome c [Sulfurospirillum sp.]